ncbi:unnamed protein product [Paramecium primaurelia]|uniref:Uncharacterized protein n=1 Tax=Paramecium primaurelia TaxID=5886 RepID=A0A8S1MWP6_PARPR|nr:unnamed protein product [Paramecium primaurelia]
MSLIYLFSLKNTTHPEYAFTFEADVMSQDFHPQSLALLAVGLYDGTVLIYDIRNKLKKPNYQSTVRTQKHTYPVWQVKWNPDISKNYNFYSISSDGRVMNWVLMKNKLEPEEVIRLRLVGKNEEESALIGLASVVYVLILINLNLIYFQQVQKKEKSINVLEHILNNIRKPIKVIIWQFIMQDRIIFMIELSYQLQQIGQQKYRTQKFHHKL